jgi:hypothetical protein
MIQLPEVTTNRGNTPHKEERQCWRDQGIGLPQAMGLGPLAQPLFYQYKCTYEPAELLQGNGSMQNLAMLGGICN